MEKAVILLTLALSAASCHLIAQDDPQTDGGQQPPPRAAGLGRPHGPRPPMPLLAALDLNKDGIIDADEIAKASESLKKLDKDGDGKITPAEYRPHPPGGPGGPGGRRSEGRSGGPGTRGGHDRGPAPEGGHERPAPEE